MDINKQINRQHKLSLISDKLESYNGEMPSEFARQPRRLDELKQWKATEFRQFLLYTGPVVLKHVLSKSFYSHFLTLSVAMSIMLDSRCATTASYLQYACDLLRYFVTKAKDLYGTTFTSYNVHKLVHLHEDIIHFASHSKITFRF